MKKISLMLVLAGLCIAVTAYANPDKEKKEKEKAAMQSAAERVIKLIECRLWTFIPESVSLPSSIVIENLRSDLNMISISGNKMRVKMDYSSGNLQSRVNGYQARHAVRNAIQAGPAIGTIPPMYCSISTILEQEISTSKNFKHVYVKIKYEIEDSNFNDTCSNRMLEFYINTLDLSTSVNCYGMHFEETYYGRIVKPDMSKVHIIETSTPVIIHPDVD